jgi:N-acetylneuraminic acid mutarotase
MSGSPLPGESKVLKVGEIPVDVLKVSNISVLSNQQWKGTGLGSVVPSLQNALFMAPQAEGDKWIKKSDMPNTRMDTCSEMVNGKIYLMGGNGKLVEEYNPATDKWARKADMLIGRGLFAASTVNSKIYVMGGIGDVRLEQTVEEYNPENDTWTMKTDILTARFNFSASAVNGKIYAIGGSDMMNNYLSTVEEYDPATDTWTKKADMPVKMVQHGTSVVNGKIYTFWNNMVFEYNPITDIWTRKTDIPTPRIWVTSCSVGKKIYVIGGREPFEVGERILPTVEEYDPVTDTWTKKSDMLTARMHFSVSAVNGRIYAFGGCVKIDPQEFISTSAVEEYDPGIGESINPKGKLPTTWGEIRTAMNR